MAVTKVSRMWQALWVPANPLRNLVALVALTIAFLLLGFHFRPSANGPARIPDAPVLTVTFQPSLSNVSIDLSLVQPARTGARAKLKIDAAGLFRSRESGVRWTMYVQGFRGYICTQRPYQASFKTFDGPQNYRISRSSKIPVIPGTPFLIVDLCWKSRPPVAISGSYISAALPSIIAVPNQVGTVTRSLGPLRGTSLSAYTLAVGIAPTKIDSRSWNWTSPLSDNSASQASAGIGVIGSSVVGLQHENFDAFLSGIFLGIAGGAAVAGVVALLDVVSRRVAGRKPPAGTGSHPPSKATRSSDAKGNTADDPATSRSGADASHHTIS
jgi:hypothetical protein